MYFKNVWYAFLPELFVALRYWPSVREAYICQGWEFLVLFWKNFSYLFFSLLDYLLNLCLKKLVGFGPGNYVPTNILSNIWLIEKYQKNIQHLSQYLCCRGFCSIGDEIFAHAFENQTLPFAEWTHKAHLRMAWYYISDLGKDDAIPAIK